MEFDVVVAADGSVVQVIPAADLAEPIRALLIKRVSQWRYQAPLWHGQPVQLTTHMGLRLQAVPTTTGGFAVRVLRIETRFDKDSEWGPRAPDYPDGAQRRGVGGQFVYAMRVETDGSLTNAKRIFPEKDGDKYAVALDEAALASISESRWRPSIVNGSPVACDVLFPITFSTQDSEPLPAIDLKQYKDGMKDPCPSAKLETKIENTIL